jgi:hypothetical protein
VKQYGYQTISPISRKNELNTLQNHRTAKYKTITGSKIKSIKYLSAVRKIQNIHNVQQRERNSFRTGHEEGL